MRSKIRRGAPKDINEKRGGARLKLALLSCAAALSIMICFIIISGDYLLIRLYKEQRKTAEALLNQTPVPVISPILQPEPIKSAEPAAPDNGTTAKPEPARPYIEGDIQGVDFPDYDTGEGADFSYQSDEVRIAVKKHKRAGAVYYTADIWIRNIYSFKTAYVKGENVKAEKIARTNKAILAVNGDWAPSGLIRNGKLLGRAPDNKNANYSGMTEYEKYSDSVCALYYDGTMRLIKFGDFDAYDKSIWQAWKFGPAFVMDSKPLEGVKKHSRNPRTMLCYYEKGHYGLVVIDGRQKGYSTGMNFLEMQKLALELNADIAYNLDGGGSSMMVYDNKTISSPSGKGKARRLRDMLIISEYSGGDSPK